MTTKQYLCGTDYRHEMQMGSAIFYPTEAALKASSQCWEECGIVEIELDEAGEEVGMKWIVPEE